MYFNEKEDTNIDKEFKKEFNLGDFLREHIKGIIIFVIVLLLLIVILFVFLKARNKTEYAISLNGGNEITVYQGVNYTDPGYRAYDNHHNDLTSSVKVNGQVKTDVVGKYTITYTVGNKSVNRVVNVIEKPQVATVIHLKGDINMTIGVGVTYEEPGYSVVDAKDGNLADKVEVTNNVDTSKPGIYRVIYSVVNSDGVTTTVARTVTVKDVPKIANGK